ncbi:DUF1415 domain-containing protein [Pseudohalioglobus lutimaris]|uniref:DUF1415 domain-containing protein n=1 Tax=Pseudohalioglobus lutimaris TaxID=1737061 RepID=A0A2N5X902_9GAMM|nr:DUF1415 domain-containing protein [Pseudohalioglobus lutimaris]PLW70939.1 DUF1415 domain-containing protein [Pseudohalioglobus lutimaris]
MLDPARAEAHTRRWLTEFVVGLNLCPFARPMLDNPQLRIAVCGGADDEALSRFFLNELDLLQSTAEAEVATSLLVFTAALVDFDDYLDFLDFSQGLLIDAGLEGLVQLASFHPEYRFAGEADNAASHFSNRAPWPTIHLIREDMLSRVLGEFPDAEAIPQSNIETLEGLGVDEMQRRWDALGS